MQNTLLIIPVYNSSEFLYELIQRVNKHIDQEHILYLNDGSTDNSLDILKKSGSKYLSFPNNRGKGEVLLDGFQYALKNNYQYVLTMDSDLQHLPEEIPRFLSQSESSSIIVGQREISNSKMPAHRRLSNRLTSALISIFSDCKISDSQCGFRLIPVNLIRQLSFDAGGYQLESELLLKAGAKGEQICQVPITTVYNNAPSSINHIGDTFRFVGQLWRRIWY